MYTNTGCVHHHSYKRNFNLHGQGLNAHFVFGYTKHAEINTIQNSVPSIFNTLIENLQEVIYNYSLARINNVIDIIETPKFIAMITKQLKMIQQKIKNEPSQNKLRELLKNIYEGLQQSVIQNATLLNTIEQLEKCKERSSILDNTDKLKEHIEKINASYRLFDIPNIKSIAAKLKPEYAKYIELYGYPEGSVFDTDKLNDIRIELNIV